MFSSFFFMRCNIILFCFFISLNIKAQKPLLDTSCVKSWPSIHNGAISNNGKYVCYDISYVYNYQVGKSIKILKSIDGKWQQEIEKSNNVRFSDDSKYAFVSLENGSVIIWKLGTTLKVKIDSISYWNLAGSKLVYMLNSEPTKMHVKNIDNEEEIIIDDIIEYSFKDNQSVLFVKRNNVDGLNKLVLFNLKTNISISVWEGMPIPQNVIWGQGMQFAFILNENGKNQLWVYKAEEGSAKMILSNRNLGLDSSYQIFNLHSFTNDGKRIYFYVAPKYIPNPKNHSFVKNNVLEIFNYKDDNLQEKMNNREKLSYLAIINLNNNKVTQLEDKQTQVSRIGNKFCILKDMDSIVGKSDKYWISPNNRNQRILIFDKEITRGIDFDNYFVSKWEKYLLVFDSKLKAGFTYEIASGLMRNITKNTSDSSYWYPYQNDKVNSENLSNFYQSKWLDNDNILLVHDQNDIWQIDPSGIRLPDNLTNNYGKKYHIRFDLLYDEEINYKKDERIMISAFNRFNKDNGFYYIKLGKSLDPLKIVMAPYLFYFPYEKIADGGELPIKAKNANIWLVRRSESTTSPNYFTTRDFKVFYPVSDIRPELKYNWLQTELYSYTSSLGDQLQGILYKPEDFDDKKKYPLIVYIYEKLSNNLHVYFAPEISSGPIDIPWFVSHGYLVFTPDIHYSIGNTGKSVFDGVMAAVNRMIKEPFIDSTKLGIQGHSFGGYETTYMVTHTNVFAAACSASGISDLIREFGGFGEEGSFQYKVTNQQYRMQQTIWENQDRYIENSPYFSLDKVTTPWLIMQTDKDVSTILSQAWALFTGLRRLNKKSWLLVYKNENHTLGNDQSAKDYAVRLDQFFDHYLKGKPAPLWMINGNYNNTVNLSEGLKLDTLNRFP